MMKILSYTESKSQLSMFSPRHQEIIKGFGTHLADKGRLSTLFVAGSVSPQRRHSSHSAISNKGTFASGHPLSHKNIGGRIQLSFISFQIIVVASYNYPPLL